MAGVSPQPVHSEALSDLGDEKVSIVRCEVVEQVEDSPISGTDQIHLSTIRLLFAHIGCVISFPSNRLKLTLCRAALALFLATVDAVQLFAPQE